jgi:very-short-patch-repair endonuclease
MAAKRSWLERILEAALAQEEFPPYEPEYHFDTPDSKRRLDFAWVDQRVGVEVQGGLWGMQAHNHPTSIGKDYRKLNAAQLKGWIVLQFSGDMIEKEMPEVLRLIEQALRVRNAPIKDYQKAIGELFNGETD